ncbi:MAG: ABC transporter permease, partial [Fervidobacterium sp.]
SDDVKKSFSYLLGLVLIFLIWHFVSHVINSKFILPSPYIVLSTIVKEIGKSLLWISLIQTLSKVFVVLFLVVFFGVFIGFVIGINKVLFDVFRPFILFIQAFPIVTWLALIMFIWGIGWMGPVVVSFLSLLPYAILSTAVGIQTTDVRLIEMAKLYNVRKAKVIKDIYLGSILPQFVSTLQVVIGNIWKVVVVAEYMCGDKGVGVQIAWARQSVSVEKVYAYTIIIIAIGLSVENIINRFSRKAIEKWSVS